MRAEAVRIEELEAAMIASRGGVDYRRYQAVYMSLTTKLAQGEIGRITGFSREWVSKLVKRYEREGVAGFGVKPRGGRRRELQTLEEEKAFIGSYIEQAKEGKILTVSKVHEALEAKVGKEVQRSAIYKMLHRHGWRKISPRPQHPKAASASMEAFKKMA